MRIPESLLAVTLAMLLLTACQPSTPVAIPVPPVSTVPPARPTAPEGKPPGDTPGPTINGFLKPYGADGENWPPNAEVIIQVYDHPQGQVLYTGRAATDQNGHFFQDVGLTTRPGMEVTVAYGQETRSVVLTPLAVTAFDLAGDTVSGTATPGANVVVIVGDNSKTVVLEAVTSGAGEWRVDTSGRLDLTATVGVQAVVRDAEGDGTAFKTGP